MSRKPSKWTRTLIVRAIRRHRAEGHDLSYSRMLRTDPRLVGAAVRCLGGWRQAVVAAGLDYDLVRAAGRARRSAAITRWTPESLLQEIRRSWRLGQDVRASAVRARLPGLHGAALKQYPSWEHVLRAAGLSSQDVNVARDLHRNWKRRWLARLQAQAAGLERATGQKRQGYRRAFGVEETVLASDWLERLRSGVGS